MADITQEIDQVAEQMEKSATPPKEILFETIRQLGPDGIRAKLPLLEKAEKELLISTLEEMKKAVSMDDQYQAKFVQGNIKDTKLQEDKADDDQDEKLVKPEAAEHPHQGTPTEGWEGQVIKGKDSMKNEMKEIADKEADKEVKEHEEKMHAAKKKVKSGKKDEMKEGLKEMKKALEEKLGSTDAELIKGEMKKLLAEEDQNGDAPEMNEKTRANKEKVKELELSSDNKDAQKEVNDMKQGMKKAVWGGENDLLKSLTGGRNHHFSMEEYVTEVLKSAEKPAEDLKKSEPSKDDLNEIIAKSEDVSWDEYNCDRMVKANKEKIRGRVVKSFEDNEIAQALGLSEEEAKKILGE